MRTQLIALALTAAALQPAAADTVSLNFENLSAAAVQLTTQFSGNGVVFSGDAWGVKSRYNGCGGNASFLHTGSCGAVLLADNVSGGPISNPYSDFTVSLTGGFVNEVSFAYSALSGADVLIQLFDATGSLLAQVGNLTTANCASTGVSFCNWFDGSIAFAGVATSIVFSAIDQTLMIDDLKFTTPAASGTVPEPGSIALALGALGALAWTRKRHSR
jgi:hypothetical protein